ncbi:MAG: SDR family oxidoreductase [Planctomycetes bacterium]|nr:SDR family oxidoreductase [Planctomycetota bacterium]
MSQHKHVLITGTSSGFGFEGAKALAARGHKVSATMRGVNGKNENAAAALRAFAEKGGYDLKVIELDVTDQASVDQAVKEASAAAPIDVLINNAGVGVWGIDEGYSVDQAKQIFEVNLFGPMRVTRAVLPAMRQAKQGLLMYVSSGLGRFVLPFMAIYNSSKYALEGYVETCNVELAPEGVKSLIIEPGAFGTDIAGKNPEPARDLTSEYGPTAAVFQAFSNAFEENRSAGNLGDPQMVVDAFVEEVERPNGPVSLRRPVGHDVFAPVSALNAASEQCQKDIFATFGLA